MVTLLNGLVGGLIATIVMTMFMMTRGDDSPPPTALFWSKYIGDGNPSEYMMPGLFLHLFYGIIAGGVLAGIIPLFGFISTATIPAGVTWGLLYGVLLFVFAAIFWMKFVLGLDADKRMVGMFLVFHLVYGAVLGAWLGLGILG